jgi:hypothetical protein
MEECGLIIDFKIMPLTFVMLEKALRLELRGNVTFSPAVNSNAFGFLYENTSSE